MPRAGPESKRNTDRRRRQSKAVAWVGCSGWQYKDWRGIFYPSELGPAAWFDFYARHFDTVEINNTFYRLPERPVFREWRRRAPRRFVYAVKASRFLTHMKKLKEPEEPLVRFLDRAQILGPALGPILFQLPPRWPVNVQRLTDFLAALPPHRQCVLEFRDPTWYTDEVIAALTAKQVALCLHDMPGSAPDRRIVTAPFVYVRFHGTHTFNKYSGTYSDAALDSWAGWLSDRLQSGMPVYAYFNNDGGGYAPRDALRLRQKII